MKTDILRHSNHLSYKDDNLFIEETSFLEIGEKFQTPIYCYSTKQIKNNFNELKNAFRKIKPMICYAVKANFNKKIIEMLAKIGAGMDVVSGGELKLSLESGVDSQKIVFSGVGKTEDEIKLAILKNIKQLNVESEEELSEINSLCLILKKKINVSLRVNPNIDAGTHEKISTGRSEDKFGISKNKILNIFKMYKSNQNIKINGLSIHIGSQIKELAPFEKAFKEIKSLILSLKKEGLECQTLDLGGGFAIEYDDSEILNISEYALLVEKTFSDLNLEIILEPGRFIVGSAGVLLSKVVRTKKGEKKNFLIIDAGMNNLIRPSLYNAFHKIIPVRRGIKEKTYDIVGPICETSDTFLKNQKIQEMKKDDYLIVCSSGAYAACMASNYNLRGIAKEILINGKKIFET